MNSALLQLLDEQRTAPLPPLTRRDLRLPELPGMATALVGMRRAGKSYVLFQEMQRLLAAGTPRSSILSLNLEDDRLGQPDLALLSEALEYLFRTGPRRHEQPAYIFLDEVQAVPGWERFVLRVLNTENVRVLVTGSSAKLLSTEIATRLRGRSTAVEVLPFSFREYLRHRGLEELGASPLSAAARSELERSFDEYLRVGGFPGVQAMVPVDRRRTLQDYVDLVVFRDIVDRWGVANLVALKWLVARLLGSFSREFTIHKLHNDLKAQGIPAGKDTLHAYLGHLTDARLIHVVGIRRASHRARQVNPRKVYAADPGLASAVAHPSAEDTGHLLENAVYLELRRRYSRLHDDAVTYFAEAAGGADFVVDTGGEAPHIVQVCATLAPPGTRELELRGAEAAMAGLGINQATLVTLYESERIRTASGTVEVVPGWRWSLGNP